ncbi:unnamed protein product, partial [Symbiodinium sp. KB8]
VGWQLPRHAGKTGQDTHLCGRVLGALPRGWIGPAPGLGPYRTSGAGRTLGWRAAWAPKLPGDRTSGREVLRGDLAAEAIASRGRHSAVPGLLGPCPRNTCEP